MLTLVTHQGPPEAYALGEILGRESMTYPPSSQLAVEVKRPSFHVFIMHGRETLVVTCHLFDGSSDTESFLANT